MSRSKFPGEFGPEHTGVWESTAGWLGWSPSADTVQAAWPSGWPVGVTTLTVHLDEPTPSPAGATYQEVAFGPVQQQSTPVSVDTSVPVYELHFPEGDFQVALQVNNGGLRWYVWSQDIAQVPASFHLQPGWQITMERVQGPYAIPADRYLRTAVDPAL